MILSLHGTCFARNLPKKADASEVYILARKSIAYVESNGNVCAKNRLTSASGRYQFMRGWNTFFKRHYGRTWTSVVPKCKAPASVKSAMAEHQDAMFDVYYNLQVSPWITEIREAGLGERASDVELLAIFHRQGAYQGFRYLKYGSDWANGKWGNKHVKDHVFRVNKTLNEFLGVKRHLGLAWEELST